MKEPNKLKNGDKVVMHSCGEAGFYKGKIWTCSGDSFQNSNTAEVIFLEGFSGTFLCKYLQEVKINNIEESKEILKKAMSKFGEKAQIDMIVEECAELIQAIQKLKRNPLDPAVKANVCDEIADVKIMMSQADLIFDKKLIDKRIDFKLKRLEERLKD